MIRLKTVRFRGMGVKFLAKSSDYFTIEEGHEIWLEGNAVWIALNGYKKIVSGVPFDAEVFAEDAPMSPKEIAKLSLESEPPKPTQAKAKPAAA